MRELGQDLRKNALGRKHVFPPGQPPSCAESFRLAASWRAGLGALERWRLQLRHATLGSPIAFPVWLESSLEKRTKTAPAPRLPRAITLSSELRFAQTLYRWEEDVKSFPVICCMTHFEFRKTYKTALENWVKKGYARENWGRFGEVLAWKDKIATWQLHGSRGIIMRSAAWCHARRARLSIKPALPPSFADNFCSSPKAVWA